MGGKGGGFSGTSIKDTWIKPRRGWNQGRMVGMAGVGGSGGGKRQTTVFEQQYNKKIKIKINTLKF